MDEMTNYLTTLDDNNKPMINPTYYKNIIIDYIETYKTETKKDKLTSNNLLYIYNNIFTQVFKNEQKYHDDNKCNIPYTQYNIESLLKVYIDITLSYECLPSLYGFSRLVGIDEETVKKYVTSSSLEMLNLRKEMLRNELYSDRMGRIVLANNDSSFGLEYERKNTIERETIKQGLSINELPKLG